MSQGSSGLRHHRQPAHSPQQLLSSYRKQRSPRRRSQFQKRLSAKTCQGHPTSRAVRPRSPALRLARRKPPRLPAAQQQTGPLPGRWGSLPVRLQRGPSQTARSRRPTSPSSRPIALPSAPRRSPPTGSPTRPTASEAPAAAPASVSHKAVFPPPAGVVTPAVGPVDWGGRGAACGWHSAPLPPAVRADGIQTPPRVRWPLWLGPLWLVALLPAVTPVTQP